MSDSNTAASRNHPLWEGYSARRRRLVAAVYGREDRLPAEEQDRQRRRRYRNYTEYEEVTGGIFLQSCGGGVRVLRKRPGRS